jgi:hypothetical protein
MSDEPIDLSESSLLAAIAKLAPDRRKAVWRSVRNAGLDVEAGYRLVPEAKYNELMADLKALANFTPRTLEQICHLLKRLKSFRDRDKKAGKAQRKSAT